MRLQPDKRIDLPQILRKCLRLIHTKLGSFILLPVQIRYIYPVKIDQDQLSDASAGKCNGNIRAKSTQTAYRNHGTTKFLLPLFSMTRIQRPHPFFLCKH